VSVPAPAPVPVSLPVPVPVPGPGPGPVAGQATAAATAAAAAAADPPSAYSLEGLRGVLHRLAGTRDGALVLDCDFDPPAAYEGWSCVYVLECRRGDEPPFLYVGETESIRERLATHRRLTFSKHAVRALIAKSPNKSASRLMETLLIKDFKARGLDVQRDSDGSHKKFGSATRK